MLFNDSITQFIYYLESKEYAKQTVTGYRKEIQYLKQWLEDIYNGPVYVDDISRENIEEYLAKMKDRGCAASTRNRVYFVLRSFFSYATRERIVDSNPMEEIKPTRTRMKERTFLTKGEVEALTGAITHPVIRAAVWTAYYTGLRPSELLNLRIEDLDLGPGIVHVKQGKGNKDRDIPICDDLKCILREYMVKHRPNVLSQKIFVTAQSGRLSLQFLNRKIKEAVVSLGWQKGISAHILRHSFASRLVKMDVNMYKIQRLLGHSSINVTAIYAHSNMQDLLDAVKKL